jgi:hypothetical protein
MKEEVIRRILGARITRFGVAVERYGILKFQDYFCGFFQG